MKPLSNWDSMGAPAGALRLDNLAVGHNKDGRLEIFAIEGGALWHKYQLKANGPWSAWDSMGAPTGGTILLGHFTVGCSKDGRLEIFAIGSDVELWHKYQLKANGPWSAWKNIGAPTGGVQLHAPPVGRNEDGRLEIFAIGSDGALWHKYQQEANGPWSAWDSMGVPAGVGRFYTLAVGENQDGRLEIFAGGGTPGGGEFKLSDVALWHKYQQEANGPWSAWDSLATPFDLFYMFYPAVGHNKDGRLEIFAIGHNALWHKYQQEANGPWSAWKNMGAPTGGVMLLSHLAVGRNQDGRLEVFANGISGSGPTSVIKPWHIWQVAPNNGWSNWSDMGSPSQKTFGSLTVGKNQDGRLEIFAISEEDQAVWHIWQK